MTIKFRHAVNNKHQNGVAVIWMALLLIPIMGFTFWAIEGTRYIQESSRLRDATEVAALAVTIEDNEEYSSEMATHYIKSYVRDIKSSDLITLRLHQDNALEVDNLDFIQYTVKAKTIHDSWFSNLLTPSFNEQQTLAGRSVARKYSDYLGNNNIDIVFVSDFSWSMNDAWGDTGACRVDSCKIDDLKTTIKRISEEILCTEVSDEGDSNCFVDESSSNSKKNKNRVAVVPYNLRTRELSEDGTAKVVSHLVYKDENINGNIVSTYGYNDVVWDDWRTYNKSEIIDIACLDNSVSCSININEQQYARRILDVFEESNRDVNKSGYGNKADVFNYIDYSNSVLNMFEDKKDLHSNYYRTNNNRLFFGFGYEDPLQFYNIELSKDINDINLIDGMYVNGRTAAFQGILKGIQVISSGNPNSSGIEQSDYDEKVKMLLILSDGKENPKNGVLEELVNSGMCNEAREEISNLYIGVIGIDFEASEESGFQNCVLNPDEDIIDVSNLDELIEKIKELIQKGTKSRGITKLY